MVIDHILYGAPDLDSAVDELEQLLGVRAAGGGQHPGQGTHNRLLALGPATYLEIIAPDPSQPTPAEGRPYGVDGITRPGIIGWALACDDIHQARAAARSHGFDPGEVMQGRRRTPTGTVLHWSLTANARAAGLVPFLISWGDTPHPAGSAPAGLTLDGLHLEHPDPETIAPALRALGADVASRPAGTPAIVARITGPHGSVQLR